MQKYWCNFLALSLKLILYLLDMTQLYIYLNMSGKASHSPIPIGIHQYANIQAAAYKEVQ